VALGRRESKAQIIFKGDGTIVMRPGDTVGNWVAATGDRVIVWWPGEVSNHDLLTFDPTFTTMKKIWLGDTSAKHPDVGRLIKR
jgi:hypothetical protein